MCHGSTGTTIARDLGQYIGCQPEYNVRKLETLHTLKLSLTSPETRAIRDSRSGYGCGASCGKLYPLTDEEYAALLVDNQAILALRINNGGHHWIFERDKFFAEWWPSSAKLVFQRQYQRGVHVYDWTQAAREIERRLPRG
jgi:hypothetical protein